MEDLPTPESLAPGDIVGPWLLESRAGRGTYGVVYRARRAGHPESEPVALKLALFPDDPRFVREVKLLTRFQHPVVPGLIDRGWWRAEGGAVHPYLVMQWVEGVPLYAWAELYDPTSRQVLLVLAQLAWGLDAMHGEKCLHRDVKGDNVRVAPNGRATLMDYGSGTWAGAALITEGPMPPGTRDYRSPEALRFHWTALRRKGAHYEASPADDVYALGVSMYRVVTGVHPPPGTDPEAREDPLRPPPPLRLLPQALNGWVAPELAALIEWMLADAPQDRPSARQVAAAAEAAAKRSAPKLALPLSGPMPVRAETIRMQVRVRDEAQARSWSWLPLASLALGLLLAVFLWCAPRRQEQELPEDVSAGTHAETPDAGVSKDGGTADLGDTAVTARAAFEGEPFPPEAISQEMPEEPLSGQRRPPCLPGQVELNGGCWKRLVDSAPPCGEDEYEWKGSCYLPVLKRPRSRPPTSDK